MYKYDANDRILGKNTVRIRNVIEVKTAFLSYGFQQFINIKKSILLLLNYKKNELSRDLLHNSIWAFYAD